MPAHQCVGVNVSLPMQPYLFGAILNRDQALQAILDQALLAGCDWTKDTPTSGSPAHEVAKSS